ncbi:MAG: DUF1385 domain-containing protein [Oscillospiraceae bacterium]|nr:DUF1385 domain-containing protein [Oscillospiraceae bacterium]
MSEKKQHKSKIGGQALIEGIMMKGVRTSAMACRLPDGTIDVETWEDNNGADAPWYKKTPFIRGTFNFVSSLISGYKCLMKSADKQMTDDEEPESKFDIWLTEHLGEKITGIVSVVALIIGLAMSLFLFKFIPTVATKSLVDIPVLRTFLEGILKIVIFICYIAITARMKDIRRTYEYHGAEHKTIACLESGQELTVANVKTNSRFHPRCGTSFILISLFISILVFCFIPKFASFNSTAAIFIRLGLQILLLPVILGFSYELIRLAGRKDNAFTRAISAPGLKLQRLTTREPDDSQIEVAIAAIKPCIPEKLEEDNW